jgi:hypothetical protein
MTTQKGATVERTLSPSKAATAAPAPPQITMVMEDITPEQAEKYLAMNVDHNRAVRDIKVSRYANSMTEGHWLATSSTIKFDRDGHLIDGQHRLMAIIRAGITVRMAVARNESPASIHVIDTNTPRNGGDSLVFAGLTPRGKATQIAGTANALNGWQNGYYTNAMSALNYGERMSNDEMVVFVREHHAILLEALDVADRVHRMVPLNKSGIALAYIVLKNVDAEAANEFFNRLAEGILHGATDPLLTLTRKVNADRLTPTGRQAITGTTLYLILRTWNAWREGEVLAKYQYGSKKGGWTAIPRPV